jgi:hypothetical protein
MSAPDEEKILPDVLCSAMDASCVLVCSCTSCGQTSVLLQCAQVARICAGARSQHTVGSVDIIHRIAPVLIRFRSGAQAATQLRSLNVLTVVAVFHCMFACGSVLLSCSALQVVVRVSVAFWACRVLVVVRLRCALQTDEFVCCGTFCVAGWSVFTAFRSLMSVLTVFLSELCACPSQY